MARPPSAPRARRPRCAAAGRTHGSIEGRSEGPGAAGGSPARQPCEAGTEDQPGGAQHGVPRRMRRPRRGYYCGSEPRGGRSGGRGGGGGGGGAPARTVGETGRAGEGRGRGEAGERAAGWGASRGGPGRSRALPGSQSARLAGRPVGTRVAGPGGPGAGAVSRLGPPAPSAPACSPRLDKARTSRRGAPALPGPHS